MLSPVRRSLDGLAAAARDRRGVSAVEFAIGAPVFILLLLAGVDSARYVLATRRVERVAATIGQMVSVNTTGTIAPADLQFYEDSGFSIFPQVLADATQLGVAWSADLPMTVTNVTLSTKNGKAVAMVDWSAGPAKRACNIPLTMVSDTAPPSPTTLPQDAFGTGTIIVVDVAYRFRPTIAPRTLAPITIARSYYVAPRYVGSIDFSGPASGTVNQC